MALEAVIFDVDGTLIDTNQIHVQAWQRAMEKHRFTVAPDRIFVEIGKGGDHFVPDLLGDQVEREQGDSLRKGHTKEFIALSESNAFPVFRKVRELLAELRRRGLKTVLATSSKKDHLAHTQRSAGIDLTSLVDEVITADDASESKPSPDLVTAAVKRLKMSPAQCAMVGDTPYDAQACLGAGVVCLAVACGGFEESELLGSGARKVYADPAALLDGLDDALRVASPGKAILTQELLEILMREALAQARAGMESGEAPIGCVLADGSGKIIARGFNEMNRRQGKTAHAEMVAFERAAGKTPLDERDLILISTLEPCVMCTGAAMVAAVDTIVYGLKAPNDGGSIRVRPPRSPESQMPRIVGSVLAQESRQLLQQWLNSDSPNPQQAAYVKQLLASQ